MSAHAAKRPQPVLTRAAVVTIISVLSALLVAVGAGSVADWLTAYADTIAGVILAAGPLVSAVLARGKVTPVDAPQNSDGVKLVPAGSAAATLDAANVLAEADSIHPTG